MPVVVAEGLSKSYGGFNAVNNLSLTIDEGTITGLIGPANKVQTLAFFAIPIGFVLALPWLSDLRKARAVRN